MGFESLKLPVCLAKYAKPKLESATSQENGEAYANPCFPSIKTSWLQGIKYYSHPNTRQNNIRIQQDVK